MVSPKLAGIAAAASLMVCLTGCIGLSTSNTSNQVASDFSISINPASATLAIDGNTSVTANVAAIGNFSGTVQLTVTGQPAGITATLSSTSVSGSGTPTVTFSASSSAAQGTYQMTLGHQYEPKLFAGGLAQLANGGSQSEYELWRERGGAERIHRDHISHGERLAIRNAGNFFACIHYRCGNCDAEYFDDQLHGARNLYADDCRSQRVTESKHARDCDRDAIHCDPEFFDFGLAKFAVYQRGKQH